MVGLGMLASARSTAALSGASGWTTGRSGFDSADTPTMQRQLRAVGGTVVKKARPKAEALRPTSAAEQNALGLLPGEKYFRL